MSYTFSKRWIMRANYSTFADGYDSCRSPEPIRLTKGGEGASGLDFPHTASLYFVYELPFFKPSEDSWGHILAATKPVVHGVSMVPA